MPSDGTTKDALIAALEGTGGADGQDFADWANSLIELSQLNSDVLQELESILGQITFT